MRLGLKLISLFCVIFPISLMAHGAADGLQVLEYAVKAKRTAVIDALFESGLYISAKNSPGWLQTELA